MSATTTTRTTADADGVIILSETATSATWLCREQARNDALPRAPGAATNIAVATTAPRTREVRSKGANRRDGGTGADDDAPPSWLSINGLARRWSCSRAFVYRAIGEMERGGYLKRLYLGKSDQRIALASVETWERMHATPAGEPAERRSDLAELRQRNAPRAKARRSAVVVGPRTRPSLREAWRKLKASAPSS